MNTIKIIALVLLLQGCAYNVYNDPNIIMPRAWYPVNQPLPQHVIDHEAEQMNRALDNMCYGNVT